MMANNSPPEEILLMLSSCNQSIAAHPYASIDAPGMEIRWGGVKL